MIDVFMIDAPWPKKKGGLRKERPNQTRLLDYETMSLDEIFTLLDCNIFIYAKENHCVFMWVVDEFLIECEKRMADRHYKRHCRFIWDKTNGIAPAFTIRFCHEYLIWYYKVKFTPIDITKRGKYKTVFVEKAREHSRKPNISYEMIELMYPNANRMDVFSREQRTGWHQFGNQTGYFKENSQ